jgi:hypothetical protein
MKQDNRKSGSLKWFRLPLFYGNKLIICVRVWLLSPIFSEQLFWRQVWLLFWPLS